MNFDQYVASRRGIGGWGTNPSDRGEAELIIKSRKFGEVIVLLDKNDIDRVKAFGKWYVNQDYRTHRKYVVCQETGATHATRKKIALHRFITDAPPDKVVDHINHNTLDNRRVNLRATSAAVNARNRENVRGYYWCVATEKFAPNIRVNGKRIYGKQQTTEEEAHKEYLRLKETYGAIA